MKTYQATRLSKHIVTTPTQRQHSFIGVAVVYIVVVVVSVVVVVVNVVVVALLVVTDHIIFSCGQ